MEIAGKVAVVTGAASGIGRASAVALAREGASVVVVDVDEAGGLDTVGQIAAAGGTAVFQRGDVRELSDIAAALDRAAAEFGGVDIVHNNAGIVCGTPSWPDTAPERLSDMVLINFGAMVLGTRLAVDHLRRRGGGAVVNTSSVAALSPMPDDPTYAATKAGVVMFTQSCSAMQERENIRVNAILPGMVDTPILAKTGDGVEPAAWLRPMLGTVTMLRPEEIADVVVEMVRDESLNGETRVVMNQMGETPASP